MQSRQNERGATAVMVAGILLVLMGLVSLAIDGGLAFNERRGAQNAADLAALAAAWQDCNPEPGIASPAAAAQTTATANGYTHNPGGFPQVVVTSSGNVWTVQIQERNETTFGRATPVAPDQITVSAEAQASCTDRGVLNGYAVFGQSSSCPGWDVSSTGSTVTINGGVHTNGGLQIPKPGSSITGDVSWRDDPPNLGAGISGSQYFGSALPYPPPLDTLSIGDYAPGGTRAVAAGSNYYSWTTNVGITQITSVPGNSSSGSDLTIGAPGIYYTSRSISLNKAITLTGAAATQGVTFVARGSIDLSQVNQAKGFDPLVPGGSLPMFLYAFGDGSASCVAKDIKIATNNATWEGVMFAPNGTAEISGANVGSLNGSVIAYNVNISASVFSITYQNDGSAEPNYQVELLE